MNSDDNLQVQNIFPFFPVFEIIVDSLHYVRNWISLSEYAVSGNSLEVNMV